jgi:hypothetical protein
MNARGSTPAAGRRRTVYLTWIAANAVSEAVGLGTTFVIGFAVAPLLDRLSGVASTLASVVLAIALGTVLEGVVVGAAQESVLRSSLPRLRRGSWTAATALGAALAWALGMIPSAIVALTSSGLASGPTTEPPVEVKMLLAAALGLIAGPILGIAQWTVLRWHVNRAGRWLWANALAWAVGMPLIFLGMDVVPWSGHPAVLMLSIYGVCGATGLVVGAIHGRVLLQLLNRSQ